MHLRAKWSAFWRYRRSARPIGRSVAGHPLYAVGDARVSLPRGSRHFSWVASCARCGRDIETRTIVRRRADLQGPDEAILCHDCARLPSEPVDLLGPNLPAPATRRVAAPDADAGRTDGGDDVGETAGDPTAEGRDDQVGDLLQELASGYRELSDWVRTNHDVNRPEVVDAPETVGYHVAAVLRSATASAEEIRAEAARIREEADADRAHAASLVAEAEEKASELREELARSLEAARRDQQEAATLLGDAEERAAELRAEAESEIDRMWEDVERKRAQIEESALGAETRAAAIVAAAEAEATQVREAAEAERAQAAEFVSQAERQASELRRSAAGNLEAASVDRERAAALLADAERRAAELRAALDGERAALRDEAAAETTRLRESAAAEVASFTAEAEAERAQANTLLSAALQAREAAENDRARAAAILAEAEERAAQLRVEAESRARRAPEATAATWDAAEEELAAAAVSLREDESGSLGENQHRS